MMTFIMLCLINIFMISSVYILKNEILNLFGYTYFEALTGGMNEIIKEHDIVIVKNQGNYEIGDIITYKDNKKYITHRIIDIEGNKIITKGKLAKEVEKK